MDEKKAILIGVDGGATGVRAYLVQRSDLSGKPVYTLGDIVSELTYEELPNFVPKPAAVQAEELQRGEAEIGPAELSLADKWLDAAAKVISEVYLETAASSCRIGIGMPGLKSNDGRSIVVINNGPRIIHYADRLTDRLAQYGIKLESPIRRLGSDGVYAGVGEDVADEGKFRDVQNAYYIGGGTGLAECLKIDERVLSLNNYGHGLPRAWEMKCSLGTTYEQVVSASTINAGYWELTGQSQRDDREFPECAAINGNAVAQDWLRRVAKILAELIFARLVSLYGDRELNPENPPMILERVVIGQRIGRLFSDPTIRPYFADHAESALVEMLATKRATNFEFVEAYLCEDRLRQGFLVGSQLRAAPAIGAAADASGDFDGEA